MREISYNRAAAIEYANQWAFGRNPKYYDFENIGGDCTNFVSQCLYAGAGVMNYTPNFGWYYLSLADRAAAWTGVEYLYQFLVSNRGAGPFANEIAAWRAEPGDIIMLYGANGTPYHSLIITATKPTVLIASHSYDALNRPLSTYVYHSAKFLHIQGVRKP